MKIISIFTLIMMMFLITLRTQSFIEITGNGWGQGLTNCRIAIADLDNDGLTDFLVGDIYGILKHFEMVSDGLEELVLKSGFFNGIDVGNNAAPALIDLDEDGLLDLLIGYAWGEVYHYEQENIGSENFNLISDNFNNISENSDVVLAFCDLDSNGLLDMAVGYHGTNGSNWLTHYEQAGPASYDFNFINDNFGSIGLVSQNAYPSFGDPDNDGLIDMFLGDFYGSLKHYEQTEQGGQVFDLLDDAFIILPGANNYMTAPVYFNLYDDEISELIIGDDHGRIHLYRQDQPNSENFNLVVNNMNSIDVGINSSPAITDLNNDGLYDLIIGNSDGTFWHFCKNPNNNLSVEFISSDFSDIQLTGATTACFGDIDNDGLIEMLVGNNEAYLFIYEQAAPSGFDFNPAGTMSVINESMGLWAPTLTDFNQDGLIDLLYTYGYEVGGWYLSGLRHYEQEELGSNQFTYSGYFPTSFAEFHYCTTFADIDNNNKLDQLDSESFASGYLMRREQEFIGSPDFVSIGPIEEIYGFNKFPALYDIDGDGDLDFIVGDYNGGLRLFLNTLITSVEAREITPTISIESHHGQIIVRQPGNDNLQIKVYNMLGQVIAENTSNNISISIPVRLSNNICIVTITSPTESFSQKVFIK
ncbi:MAG: T9SS type A sorting domain-containing protein [Bacteroidales bacterium]|nr:T9SS type A sorting domain-containing protein [Bacteroidales bacterium]